MSRSFELKEFKPGAVRMAQEAGVPILPTTIWGSQRVWSKNLPKHLGRRKIPIFITVGEPFHVAPDENRAEATDAAPGRHGGAAARPAGGLPAPDR